MGINIGAEQDAPENATGNFLEDVKTSAIWLLVLPFSAHTHGDFDSNHLASPKHLDIRG